MREKIVQIFSSLIFFILFLGLMQLSVVQNKRYAELSSRNCIRLLPQAGSRGRILDRNNELIVGDRLSYDAMVSPQNLGASADEALQKVAGILGISVEKLHARLNEGYIAAFAPVVVATNIDTKKAIALEELKPEYSGVSVQQRTTRNYPYKSLASHVLGYLSEIDRWRLTKLADYGYKTKDIVGFGGIEEKYDYYLRQEEGGLSVVVDHLGRFVRVFGFRPPRNGRDIQLTLDLRLQKIVEDELDGRKGCIIFMDPYTGEIIAMASFPNFEPALFAERSSSLSYLFQDPNAPLINRAISGLYPAGSVFKVVLATAGLQTRKLSLSTTFLCSGAKFIGRQRFACWNTHYEQNLLSAIAHSCNVFFYSTGLVLGAQTIYDYAQKFGFSKPTAVDIPYESYGFVQSPLWKKISKFQKWTDGDTANLSIGQGELLVTPLQLVRMMAVFANSGYLLKPYLLKAVDGKDVSSYQRKLSPFPVNAKVLQYVREGMRKVVTEIGGTGNILSTLPVSVAGKTGTAQVPVGGAHGWFVGFLPFEKPKFVFCVLLEHSGSGWASCALTKKILQKMIQQGLL